MNRMLVRQGLMALAALSSLSVLGCTGDDGEEEPKVEPVTSGTYNHYVSNKLFVPKTPSEKTTYGFNLDKDPDNSIDNRLGNMMVVLKNNGVDIQSTIDESLTDGKLSILHSVRADDLTKDSSVSWQVYLADQPASPPKYDGSDSYTISKDGPTNAVLNGRILGGSFVGGPGDVTIKIALVKDQPPLILNLVGARMETTVTASSCKGKLGGAIKESDLNETVLPAVANMMNASIKEDPEKDTSKTIKKLFDTEPKDNPDGVITAQELKNNDLIGTVLAADVDLFDASGKYNPRSDMKNDSLSLGVGIECVNAKFTPDNEK
ncbi:MAG: hypothetical protein HY698_05100 [Deltaproteobacteria bacterium]|nr:hypothetical protein [Deltaproteobacteria bacterium]